MPGTLGEELSTLLQKITALSLKTRSKTERQKLADLQAKVAGDLQVFIDGVVSETLPEYRHATAALNEANCAAEDARKSIDKVAVTITKVASALDKVSALATKIGIGPVS